MSFALPLALVLALGQSTGTPPLSLLELFSSEGCSSCPPADALLDRTANSDPGAVVLEFHVDYWNDLGWADPFSASAFSERQSAYARALGAKGVYTPQIVVDGREGFVGSDASRLADALSRRGRLRALLLTRSAVGVRVRGEDLSAGDLWVAVTESGLSTQVLRGENRGQTLRHAPVVRSFQHLGEISAGALDREIQVSFEPGWRLGKVSVIVGEQAPVSGPLLSLGRLSLAK